VLVILIRTSSDKVTRLFALSTYYGVGLMSILPSLRCLLSKYFIVGMWLEITALKSTGLLWSCCRASAIS